MKHPALVLVAGLAIVAFATFSGAHMQARVTGEFGVAQGLTGRGAGDARSAMGLPTAPEGE